MFPNNKETLPFNNSIEILVIIILNLKKNTMKLYLKYLFAIIFISGIANQNVNAQEAEEEKAPKEESNEQRRFGIGISLFNLNFNSVFDYYNSNSILMPINVGKKIRLEPSFGFSSSEGQKQFNPGIGVFLKKIFQNSTFCTG